MTSRGRFEMTEDGISFSSISATSSTAPGMGSSFAACAEKTHGDKWPPSYCSLSPWMPRLSRQHHVNGV
jgi:hypothetical protein